MTRYVGICRLSSPRLPVYLFSACMYVCLSLYVCLPANLSVAFYKQSTQNNWTWRSVIRSVRPSVQSVLSARCLSVRTYANVAMSSDCCNFGSPDVDGEMCVQEVKSLWQIRKKHFNCNYGCCVKAGDTVCCESDQYVNPT